MYKCDSCAAAHLSQTLFNCVIHAKKCQGATNVPGSCLQAGQTMHASSHYALARCSFMRWLCMSPLTSSLHVE